MNNLDPKLRRHLLSPILSACLLLAGMFGCVPDLSIVQPPTGSVTNDVSADIVIRFNQCDPQSLKVLLNGDDITAGFTVNASSATATSVPLRIEQNLIEASIVAQSGVTLTERSFVSVFRVEQVLSLEDPVGLTYDRETYAVYAGRRDPGQVGIRIQQIHLVPAIEGEPVGEAVVDPEPVASKVGYILCGSGSGPGRGLYLVRPNGGENIPYSDCQGLLEDIHSLTFAPVTPGTIEAGIAGSLFASTRDATGESEGFVAVADEQGNFSLFTGDLPSPPRGLAFDASGLLYIAAGDQILVSTPQGAVDTYVAYNGSARPNFLAFSEDGNLFCSEDLQGRILAISPTGENLTIAKGFVSPQGIAFGPKDEMYVADPGAGALYRIEGDFTLFGGTVHFEPTEEVTVGTYGTWRMLYTVGPVGLPVGGSITVSFQNGAAWGYPQFLRPWEESNVSARVSTSTRSRLLQSVYNHTFTLTVADQPLLPGDVIEVMLGDTSSGSPGYRAAYLAQASAEIYVFEDINGDGHAKNFSSTISTHKIPKLPVRSDQPERLVALAGSSNVLGSPVSLVVKALDQYGNVAEDYLGVVEIRAFSTGELLGQVVFGPEDRGFKRAEGLLLNGEGVHRLLVRDGSHSMETLSNPIVCTAAPGPATYWGEMHGHTWLSDGIGSIDAYYDHAREVNNLDFAAVSDHTGYPLSNPLGVNELDPASWEAIKQAVREHYVPGVFVPIVGFENSSLIYGHRNAYFFEDDPPFVEYQFTPTQLYEKLLGGAVILIPHLHRGIPGNSGINWDDYNPLLERVVEMCSNFGVKEYAGNDYFACDTEAQLYADQQRGNMIQDALARGYRLGFVAGSDSHTGSPGGYVKGNFPCSIFGLTAMRLDTLTRESIRDALMARGTYATTGTRILLSVTLNGATMGSEVPPAEERQLRVEVHGSDVVDRVEVVKNNVTVLVHACEALDTEFTYQDGAEEPVDYYYVRVIQADGEIAWSSPIWVGVEETP